MRICVITDHGYFKWMKIRVFGQSGGVLGNKAAAVSAREERRAA